MSTAARLRTHFLRPARGGAAGVVVVFSVLLWIAGNAGLLGIPLGLIVASWFFKYAYVLFDHVVRGVDEPPTLDINMVNPLDEQRPLAQLAIVAAVVAVVMLSATRSPPAAYLIAGVGLLFLPASVAILGLEGNPFKAIYPPALVRLVLGLGPLYALVQGLLAAVALTLGAMVALGLWAPLQIGVLLFAVLSMFSGLGGALYERRHELGLETWHSPERTAEKERLAEEERSQEIVTAAYGEVRVGAHAKAWDRLISWLAAREYSAMDYRWLAGRLQAWPDPRYAARLAEEYVEATLAARRAGDALDAVRERLTLDQTFRPKSAAATLAVARLAAHGGGAKRVARTLLADFGTRFPGHELAESAADLARQLGE